MNVDSTAPVGASSAQQDVSWARYRCPVCGHRDRLALHSAHRGDLECSHCDAALELRGPADGRERVEVCVRAETAPH